MRGGALTIAWAPGEPIRMRGAATHVFKGEIDLEALRDGVETITLGCRLNFAESEAMRALARRRGLDHRQQLRGHQRGGAPDPPGDPPRASRERPDARIIVTGCAAQLDPQSLRGDARGRPGRWQCRQVSASFNENRAVRMTS